MKYTIKEFKAGFDSLPYLVESKSKFDVSDTIAVSKKERPKVLKSFTEFAGFAETIFKTFKRESRIYVADGSLHYEYPNGNAKVNLKRYHFDVLMPVIENIAVRYGKVVENFDSQKMAA